MTYYLLLLNHSYSHETLLGRESASCFCLMKPYTIKYFKPEGSQQALGEEHRDLVQEFSSTSVRELGYSGDR